MSLGAVNPASASFPVIAIRRSRPIVSRISSHSASVRWSFQRIAGRRTSSCRSSATRPCICPASPTASTSSPSTPDAGEHVADRRDRSVPPELRILLAPQWLRRLERVLGSTTRRGRCLRRRAARPWWRWSRRRAPGRGSSLVLDGPDDPALAVGRHVVGRDLAQRTERLELAELVAEEHLDRRAAIRVERARLRCRRASRAPCRSSRRTHDLGRARRRSSTAEPVATASTATVSAVRCRRASPGSVYGHSTSERSACGPVASVDDGTDHPPAERELRDRPWRQRHRRRGAVP